MNSAKPKQGFKTFGIIWFGQLISLVGSGMTGFALGIWVFQETGSVTQFALISLFVTLPTILLAPFAGALVDRWDRRWVLILSDAGAGLSTLIVALLLFSGRLEVWHIYLTSGLSSAFSSFQWPAYTAATTLLVPKRHFGRASGMTQFGQAAAQIISPALAGVLVVTIEVQGVILLDFATFLFAVFTLLMIRIPKPAMSAEAEEAKGSLLQEAVFGWQYIRARVGLLGLLLLFAATNFTVSIASVVFTPMILAFSDAAVLGSLLSIGGVGMLLGSIVMSAWGGPKRKIFGVLIFEAILAVSILLAGIRPDVTLLGVSIFGAFFTLPIVNGSSQAIWQSKVTPDLQGRVFSIRRMIAWSSQPLAYLLAGPLADRVFEPMLQPDGALAGSVGKLIGVGPGRGIGFLFILLGVAGLASIVVAALYPRLRNVEDELPDAVQEEPVGEPAE
jgi:MFS family permease